MDLTYIPTNVRLNHCKNRSSRQFQRTLDELGLTTDSAGSLFLGAVNLFINIYYKLEIGDLKDRITDLENGSTGTSTATGKNFLLDYLIIILFSYFEFLQLRLLNNLYLKYHLPQSIVSGHHGIRGPLVA